MVAQELWAPGAILFLDRLEHVHQVERVVSGKRHQLNAQQVGLLLVLAAVTQKVRAQTKLRALRDDLSDVAADDGSRDRACNGANREGLLFGRAGSPVSQNDVAELVRHDAGNLALDRGRLNHAAVDVHGATRQRKRIDLAHVDDFEGGTGIHDAATRTASLAPGGVRCDPRTSRCPRLEEAATAARLPSPPAAQVPHPVPACTCCWAPQWASVRRPATPLR